MRTSFYKQKKRFLLFLGIMFVVLGNVSCTTQRKIADVSIVSIDSTSYKKSNNSEYNPHVLIVFYDTKVGSAPLLKAAKAFGSEIIYTYRIIHAVALRVPENKDMNTAINYYGQVKGVIQVERDRIMHLDSGSTVQ